MPEQQPVSDEAVQAAALAIAATRNRTLGTDGVWPSDEMAARDAVKAVARLIRAQVIRELRDAATDEGPQSAYWRAADYLERREAA